MPNVDLPKQSVPVVDDNGLVSRDWYVKLQSIAKNVNTTTEGLGAITLPNGSQSWAQQLFIPYPEDGAIALIDAPYKRTITKVTTKTTAGTSTVTVAGDGTLSGGPNSASTSQSSVSHTSGNVVSQAGTMTITLSSTSSDCTGLSITIQGTYTLA